MSKKDERLELRLTKQELTLARKSAKKRSISISVMIRRFLRRTARKDEAEEYNDG